MFIAVVVRNRCSCVWLDENGDAPRCVFGAGVGYTMTSEPVETDLGWRVALQRIDTPQVIDGSAMFDNIVVDVEMHYDYRLRIKVSTFTAFSLFTS